MIAVAAAVLLGWRWDVSVLTAVVPGQQAMRATSAIAFLLSGLALQLRYFDGPWHRAISGALSVSVLGLGAFGLLGGGVDLNEFFEPTQVLAPVSGADRRPKLAAAALVALGLLGILITIRRWLLLREAVVLLLLATSMAGIASYAFSFDNQSHNLFTSLAIHKSVLLLIATLGWIAAEPTTGLMRVASLDSFGGGIARRLLLPALLLPVVLTFVFKALEGALGISDSLALTLASTVAGGAIAGLVWAVASLVDRVERNRRAMDILRDAASTDALTGLANRRTLDAELIDFCSDRRMHSRPFSLLILDIDKFKAYNDDFGHQAGDEVLRQAGRILRAALRPNDMPARYGGEEFAIVLPATDGARAEQVAIRIVGDFRCFDWPVRAVTLSIGVAEARGDDTPAEVIRRADQALYEAKRLGRDQVIAHPQAEAPDLI